MPHRWRALPELLGRVRLKAFQRRRHVRPTIADPEVIAGLIEDRAGEKEDPRFADEVLGESVDGRSATRRGNPMLPPRGRTHSKTFAEREKNSSSSGRLVSTIPRLRRQDAFPGLERDQRHTSAGAELQIVGVVLERGQPREQIAVRVAIQPMRRTASANDLDMTPMLTPVSRASAAGRQPVGGVEFEESVRTSSTTK